MDSLSLLRECYSCFDVTNSFGGELASYIELMWNLALIYPEELKLKSELFCWFLMLSAGVEYNFVSL